MATEQQIYNLASSIKTLSGFVKGSRDQQVKQAQKLVNAILENKGNNLRSSTALDRNFWIRAAQEVYKQSDSGTYNQPQNKSITNTTAAPALSREKIPPASNYESYSECVNDLTTNYRASQAVAERYCKSVNSDGQIGPDQPVSGKSATGYDNETQCVSMLVQQGIEQQSAIQSCKVLFQGPSSEVKGSRKKSASVPYYQKVYDYTHNQLSPETPTTTNVKSASLPDFLITQLNSPTHRNRLYQAKKESTRSLKSASTDSDNRPYYTYWKYSQ
jgi:hypothetical protein